jgi:hypothetical protein
VTERGRLVIWLLVVGLGVAVWTGLAVNARATTGARTTADEPHYLLTAISLWQDHDITTGDEIQAGAYAPFHEVQLLDQTTPLADGRLVEPHDPLLPAILALPVAIGGWVGAKLTLAACAGCLAASMTWVAVRRFAVPLPIATATVTAFSLAMPLSAYATQIYPEMPAALAVALAVGALTGPLGRKGVALWLVMLVCLPWLSVKYAPVVVALAVVGAVLLWRKKSWGPSMVSGGVLAFAGVTYLLAHKAMYGGWTVYAAGEHFTAGGQLSVMGYQANYPGRTIRLIGLLVDRNFGLIAWAPVYLVAIATFAALLRARPRGWVVLVMPFAAGFANATWIAQTMQGWWSPGRQLVVVLPTVVIGTAWFVARVRAAFWPMAALGAVGILNWMWLVVEASTGRRTLVADFMQTANPIYRAWTALLPNGMSENRHDVVGYVVWGAVLAAPAVWGWREALPAERIRDRDPSQNWEEDSRCSTTSAVSVA